MMEGKFKCLKCGYDLVFDFVTDPNRTVICSQCNTEYEIHFKNGEPFLKPRKWILRLRFFLHV